MLGQQGKMRDAVLPSGGTTQKAYFSDTTRDGPMNRMKLLVQVQTQPDWSDANLNQTERALLENSLLLCFRGLLPATSRLLVPEEKRMPRGERIHRKRTVEEGMTNRKFKVKWIPRRITLLENAVNSCIH